MKAVSHVTAGTSTSIQAQNNIIALAGDQNNKQRLVRDAQGRNDGQWHAIDVPGGQVELRFARWDEDGRAVYEARGRSSTVPIYTASFDAAAKRLQQLVRGQALAPKLGLAQGLSQESRSTAATATNRKVLTIDLEDASLRDGNVPRPWLSGAPGSYLTATAAIIEAKDRGVPVRVVDLNAGKGNKNLHAYVSLANNAQGGSKYALITSGSNPPFKIPAAAGADFRQAYIDMQGRIGKQQVISTVQDLAAAAVSLPRRSQPGPARAVATTSTLNAPPSTSRGAQAKAGSATTPGRFQYGETTTDVGYLMDRFGKMLPGLNVNVQQGERNCLNCAVSLERARAGRPNSARPQQLDKDKEADVFLYYGRLPIEAPPNQKGSPQVFTMPSLLRHVESLPHGSRGILFMRNMRTMHAHATVIENFNGRAAILDGQVGLVMDPKAYSTGLLSGEQWPSGRPAPLASIPDKPWITFEFLRTDDIRNPGSALPKNVSLARVQVVDRASNRVRLDVMERTGEWSSQWVDQSATPGLLKGLLAGDNVYLVNDQSNKVRPPGMLVIKQSDGLKTLKRIDARQ
jgi:Papain fold toxin 1, glutamine deamidase